jgi:uncharacterized protein YbaA (DUF1428 family)
VDQHGALEVHECAADDVKPGKLTSFPQAVKLKPDEIGGLLVDRLQVAPPSRRREQEGHGRPPDGPHDAESMPVDGKRMFWGGFKEIVRL